MKIPRASLLTIVLTALAGQFACLQTAVAQTWATDFSLKTARWNHTATLLTNGLVLIAGGEIFNDSTNGFFRGTHSAELYSLVTGVSALIAPMTDSHWGGSATLLANGQVLVAAGRNNGGSVLATAELFDPGSLTWTNTGSLNQLRASFTSTLLPNGKVLVVAGQNDQAVDLSSAELYDPVSGTWSNTTSINYVTDTAAAVLLAEGNVLFCGGSDGQGGAHTNALIYNPANQTWTNTGPMHTARAGHAATLLPSGKVLVVGGSFDNSAELYDPASGTWTNAASMNDGRSYPEAALLPDGQVLVIGGDPGQTDTELYNPTNNTWTLAASTHVGCFFSTMTPLGDGQVVVTGGNAGTYGYYNGPAIADVETYAGHPIQTNHTLVAHYPFDADPNSDDPFSTQFLMDTSGNGYDIGGPSSGDGNYPSIASANIAGGSAVQFDGNNGYEMPTNLLATIAGSFSISLWLETTQVFGGDSDIGYDDPAFVWAGGVGDNTFDSEPMTLTGHKLGFYTGGDESTLHSATSIDSGAFTHIVVTRDQPSGVKKIYINGVLDATGVGSTNLLSDSTDLVLGESFYHGGVAGIIDDAQFYSGVLNSDDVAFLYANPGLTAPVDFAPSLDFALDDTNLTWATSGDANWFGEGDVSHDGVAAAQSGSLSDNQSSILQTTVTGPGILTFWWQTVCPDDGFDLEFDIGGVYQADLYNQISWTQRTCLVSAGPQTFTWTASTPSGSSLTDAGYVDEVTFTPTPPPPSPGMWTLTGSLTNAPYLQTATLLLNGKVLLAGGSDYNEDVFAGAELYDPATHKWSPANPLTNARFSHTATLLTNGQVLVTGGITSYSSGGLVPTSELYNPSNGIWTLTGPLHYPRYAHTATLLQDGRVLVAGGLGTNSSNPNLTNIYVSEVYDPNTGIWTTNGLLNTGRDTHTATLLSSGQVLIAGGNVPYVTLVTGSSELFDPATGLWTPTAGGMQFPLVNHTATLLPNGTVLVAGGQYDEGTPGGFSLVTSAFAVLYDPTTEMWTTTSDMHALHESHTATLLTNGLVLIAGQCDSSRNYTNDSAELYDPASQTWTIAAAMNVPRRNHTTTLLPDGQVLAAGGQDYSGTLASAELYNSVIVQTIILTNETTLANGSFQFSFTNTPGAGSTVYGTMNLSLPLPAWTPMGNATEVSAGHFQFTDAQATNLPRRFYRVTSP